MDYFGDIAKDDDYWERRGYPTTGPMCCFYTFFLQFSRSFPWRTGSFNMRAQCKCSYCGAGGGPTMNDGQPLFEHKHTERHNDNGILEYVNDYFELIIPSPCECGVPAGEKCCLSRVQGYGIAREAELKELTYMVESGDWTLLDGLVDRWLGYGPGWSGYPIYMEHSHGSGNKDCFPPLPKGWNFQVDMPTNISELNCCKDKDKKQV
jgi:hypothetical protein